MHGPPSHLVLLLLLLLFYYLYYDLAGLGRAVWTRVGREKHMTSIPSVLCHAMVIVQSGFSSKRMAS